MQHFNDIVVDFLQFVHFFIQGSIIPFDIFQMFDGDSQIVLQLLVDIVNLGVVLDELVDFLGSVFVVKSYPIQFVLSLFDLF